MTYLRQAWNALALPLVAILLAAIVGAVVILVSEILVSGEIAPGLVLAHMDTVFPHRTLADVIDFAVNGHMAGIPLLSVVVRERLLCERASHIIGSCLLL